MGPFESLIHSIKIHSQSSPKVYGNARRHTLFYFFPFVRFEAECNKFITWLSYHDSAKLNQLLMQSKIDRKKTNCWSRNRSDCDFVAQRIYENLQFGVFFLFFFYFHFRQHRRCCRCRFSLCVIHSGRVRLSVF